MLSKKQSRRCGVPATERVKELLDADDIYGAQPVGDVRAVGAQAGSAERMLTKRGGRAGGRARG